MNRRSLAALAAACWLCPAAALLTRADRDEAEYLELASRYSSSIRLHAHGGEGVLIAPRWVLTAASVARGIESSPAPRKVAIAGREAQVQSVRFSGDVALLLLATAMLATTHTPIYRGSDEAGKTWVVAAHGGSARLGAPPARADGRRRAAINTVDRVAPRHLEAAIRAGDEASDLQGALIAEEAGAAAYLQVDEQLAVAGIFVSSDGTRERYARVSAHAKWIDDAMREVAADEARALLGTDGG